MLPHKLTAFRVMHIALTSVILLFSAYAFAQQPTSDTSGYEKQRQKVNELLTQRSIRFGQFDESLKTRTGIFGLKTKKDMQASIDILKQIVLTDNDIFKETKALLDYKEFEKSQILEQASEFDGRINGYIRTISKLHRQQEKLASERDALEKTNQLYEGLVILLGFAFAGVASYIFVNRQKLTKA